MFAINKSVIYKKEKRKFNSKCEYFLQYRILIILLQIRSRIYFFEIRNLRIRLHRDTLYCF